MKPNRKQLKKKDRSCPICKPHKTRGSNRWTNKQKGIDKAHKDEIDSIGNSNN